VFHHTAHVYDLIYEATGKDYAAESSAVHALIQERKPAAASLLDVACGTGGHLRYLQRWYTVTGVDLDAAMLAEAKKRLPTTPLLEADMRTLRLPTTFDAVICLFSSVGYMRDGEELDLAISAMARHLHDGGVLIVDGWVRPDQWREVDSAHVDVAEGDAVKVVRMSRSHRRGMVTVLEMHHLIATEDGIEHVVDHHELTLFAPEEYEAAFRQAGLAVAVVDSPLEGRDRYVGVRGG
jgi:dTDP-3-amino-3,4,6-trideoxy-alpha-D-glucopyranose N,N-dimethyltransferase